MSEFDPVTWYDDPSHFRRVSRKEFLYVGLIGGLGLTLPEFFRLRAEEAQKEAKAKALIHIFLPGGISAHESFDPKPLAPIEVRGPFGSIPTKLDGVYFNEFLKETAQVADKLTIIRSITHGEAAHERGTHNMFTGYRPSPAIQYPSFGSVVSHELGSAERPAALCVHSIAAEPVRGERLPEQCLRALQPGRGPGEHGLRGAGSFAFAGRGSPAIPGAAEHPGGGRRALPGPGEE